MHILCIRYSIVLADTAVLCMRVCIVCLPIRGAPWRVLLQHCIMLQLFFIKCAIARFLCAIRVFEVRASSSSPRLPLFQVSFLLQPPCWASPRRKIAYSVTHSHNQSAYLMSRNRSLHFGTRKQNTIYTRNTKDKREKLSIANETKPWFGTPFMTFSQETAYSYL